MSRASAVQIGNLSFSKKGDALGFLRAMLNRYKPGERVNGDDASILAHALRRHPDAAVKIGPGIAHFDVRSADYGTQCFWVTRIDGTTERFSYKSCV